MNAQHPITTTPKYNFPLPEQNSQQLPQQLIELSIRTLKETQPSKPPAPQNPKTQLKDITPTLDRLEPNPTKTLTIAIDVSSIKLGETETGILLAVRGALVWKQATHYHYLRLGPFPFHITEKNQKEIRHLLRPHHQTKQQQEHIAPSIIHTQTRLTTLLERWIQTSVNQAAQDSLILLDGSLTAGTPETPVRTMEQLLKTARDNNNTILAFSKMTRLLFGGHRLTDLVWKHQPPCLVKMRNYPFYGGPFCLMGNVYVARLTGGSCAFRLDVDRQLSHVQVVEAVEKLLGNDVIAQSYPETLRLAHIFSTFTATEVLGLQRCVTEKGNIRILSRPNVRRILFGRFGKGPEG